MSGNTMRPSPQTRRLYLVWGLLVPVLAWGQSLGLTTPAVTGQFAPLPAPRPAPPPPPASSPAPSPVAPLLAADTPSAASLTLPAAPAKPPEALGCRPVSEKALAADLSAATAQAQKRPLAEQIALTSEAVALWTQAVAQCEGRPQERAQRNLQDNLRMKAQLTEQSGSGPQCEKAQRDAGALQDLARQSLSERRFAESAVLFRKAEDAWDDASELCTGSLQEVADKRREQSALDGHNAEFCAPVFERAREHTQKLRSMPASVSREDKQEQSLIAETLWRDAMAQCKGAGVDIARTNAQALARERGTPWAARIAPAEAPAPANARRTATMAAASGAVASVTPAKPTPPPAAGGSALDAIASSLGTLGSKAAGLVAAPAVTASAAAPTPLPGAPEVQPPEFVAGTTRFNGKFVRDAGTNTFSGSGKVTWPNGEVFDGNLVKGQRQGKGVFVWASGQRYEGDWVQDTPSGQGIFQFANGNRYEGDVVAGAPQGKGRMQYASGDDYRGQLRAGVPEGHGNYTWKNGQRFEGDWKSERPNGQGTLTFANGNLFEGSVVNGVPHGQGKLVFATGEVYSGAVAQGEPEGQGSFVWPNGDQYVGQWKAGKKHGQGVFTWKSGERWEGVYENDVQK
ncbi:MAG: hypothetical protein CFE44_02285 [Burkholderiales bacterium PBB4]|nr:MAG: hypothetical protein CFE44_02285 [Burkholderiales bacterium PBB4]